MKISKDDMVGAVVAENYQTAAVFERAGIDFCCNGNRSIEAACEEKKLDTNKLLSQLEECLAVSNNIASGISDYKTWPLDLLADYIEKKHHRYVTSQIPVISNLLAKIVQVHGQQHPELHGIQQLFHDGANELTAHMKKEEAILFPMIRKMVQANLAGNENVKNSFGTVQNPIRVMMHEHDTEGERFRKMRALGNEFVPPADACNTYKTAYASLEAFEKDLHLHIHLENNILFPGAIEMERAFAG